MTSDLYSLLDVSREASPHQVQAAYLHLAKQLQPDPDSTTTERLRDLEEAYAVLGHPERRNAYDRRTSRAAQRAEPMRASESRSAATQEVLLTEAFDTCQPSFDELFDRLWSNFDLVTRPKAERLQSLTVEIALSKAEANRGGEFSVLIPARAQCPSCLGHGALGGYQCWHCEGHGSITADYPVRVSYPAGLIGTHTVQVGLDRFGIQNFYLTVKFRAKDD